MAHSFFDDPTMLAPPRTVQVRFDGGAYVLRSPEPPQALRTLHRRVAGALGRGHARHRGAGRA